MGGWGGREEGKERGVESKGGLKTLVGRVIKVVEEKGRRRGVGGRGLGSLEAFKVSRWRGVEGRRGRGKA